MDCLLSSWLLLFLPLLLLLLLRCFCCYCQGRGGTSGALDVRGGNPGSWDVVPVLQVLTLHAACVQVPVSSSAPSHTHTFHAHRPGGWATVKSPDERDGPNLDHYGIFKIAQLICMSSFWEGLFGIPRQRFSKRWSVQLLSPHPFPHKSLVLLLCVYRVLLATCCVSVCVIKKSCPLVPKPPSPKSSAARW